MATLDEGSETPRTRRRRTGLEVALQQLHAIERFTEACHAVDDEGSRLAVSREQRVDLSRQREVVRREHEALNAQAHHQLESAGEPLASLAEPRVVIAHRNEWFIAKLGEVLEREDVCIAARLDNGAEAVGAVVAEQPDLALVEDALVMLAGEQVVRELRTFCTDTLVVAQVEYGERVGPLLEAGAAAVFTRSVPPGDVAQKMLDLLAAEPVT